MFFLISTIQISTFVDYKSVDYKSHAKIVINNLIILKYCVDLKQVWINE